MKTFDAAPSVTNRLLKIPNFPLKLAHMINTLIRQLYSFIELHKVLMTSPPYAEWFYLLHIM